jgi:isopentenyl-diphosphate delta-isomerase
LLLQQRAKNKYHSGGLWTNTCCSHPKAGEMILPAAHRRLKEEMGFDCELSELFSFIYKAKLDNNFIEYEFDHILAGRFDGKPALNPKEVENAKWISPDLLIKDIKKNFGSYTYWFKKCYNKVLKHEKNKHSYPYF